VYDTAQYFGLMSRRLHLLNDLLLAGVHVFVSEVDQVLFQDPLRAVDVITQGKTFDFVTLQDHSFDKIPCFGFMGIRPTPNIMIAWRDMMRKMDAAHQNEQLIFKELQNSPKFSIETIWLPTDQFWNGQRLKLTRRPFPSSLVMIHANWVAGIQNKKKLLLKKGLWDPTCIHEF